MNLPPWIENALLNGATLTVEPVLGGRRIFRARLSWPHGERIARISTTPAGALAQLETATFEDAADEMARHGGA